jgi:hypothetical protein
MLELVVIVIFVDFIFNASVGLLGISWMLPMWVVVTRILHGICIWRIMALLDISSCHGNYRLWLLNG